VIGTHKGRCSCGAVEVEVTSGPEVMGYCHCQTCRAWSAGPVNAFALWKAENVRVTNGADHLGHYQQSERSDRQYCTTCGGHVMTAHPLWGLMDVYPAILDGLRFAPSVHVNYASTVLPMKDGLPKLKDFPAEFGGSGETMPE